MTTSIALCMIVKNEEDGLARAVSSAAPWVDEIIVVDTGSTDTTVQIANEIGASVHHFKFANGVDLGAARTRSIELAHCDWALLLDGDTTLDQASGPNLKEIAASYSHPPATVGARWKNYIGSSNSQHYETYTASLLPLAPGRRMFGRRHSLYVDANGSIMPTEVADGLVIHHWGFTLDSLLTKGTSEKNREIVLLQIQETPEYAPFWIDAIRAHRSDDMAAKGLELVERFKNALETGVVRYVQESTPFQIAFYEALVAFSADSYDQAFKTASQALETAPSKDMFAVKAAVNAAVGRNREAVNGMSAAESIAVEPHPLTGRDQGSYMTSKMLCHIARAAGRVGDIQHAINWYTKGMGTIPTFIQGPIWFADFLIGIDQLDAATTLLTEALNSKPEESGFANSLVQIWRSRCKDELGSLLQQARSHWPQNAVFEHLRAEAGLVAAPQRRSESEPKR